MEDQDQGFGETLDHELRGEEEMVVCAEGMK
jgi:hypothetical protein